MADTPDTPQQGRMLFTDMDILDKERSAVGVEENIPAYVAPALTSLDDIAARIGLDFEDDDVPPVRPADGPAPRPATDQPGGDASAQAAQTAQTATADPADPGVPGASDTIPGSDSAGTGIVPDPDAVLSLDDAAPVIPFASPATFGPAALDAFPEIPTWDDFTKAFRRGDRTGSTKPISNLLSGLPAEAEHFFNVSAPAEAAPAGENPETGEETAIGSEQPDDGGRDDFLESIDALLDGEDIDILSILSQPPGPMEPAAAVSPIEPVDAGALAEPPRRRTTTVVVPPPPPIPYGGLERVEDWYVPPEDERVFTMPTDSYEPDSYKQLRSHET
ncbi:MAG: hypothetical protein LUG50_05350, partial [Planctomycetaceae bacterium]|nr:hypothetical protein [Planctomycetaceae bacterium]